MKNSAISAWYWVGWLILTGLEAAPACAQNLPASAAAIPAPMHWYVVNAGAADTLQQVIWTGKEFIAVGGNKIIYSPDGLTWTAQSFGAADKFTAIGYNAARYVAVGENGTVNMSPDLKTWTGAALPGNINGNQHLSGVLGDGNRTVVIGDQGFEAVWQDPTGNPADSVWTRRSGPSIPSVNFSRGVAIASPVPNSVARIVTGSDQGIWTGPTAWTQVMKEKVRINDVATDGKIYVAVGNGVKNLYTSPNGINWTEQHSGTNTNLEGVAGTNGTFVIVGDRGTVLMGSPSTIWTAQAADTTANFTSVATNGKIFVAVTDKGAVLASGLPALTFTTATLALSAPATPAAPAPASTPSPASGPPDPLARWSIVSSGETAQYWHAVWLDNAFVCVGTNGVLMSSPDGVSWTRQALGTTAHIFDAASNGRRWVAVGANGTIVTSPDQKTWTTQMSGTTERLFCVVWTGSQFLAGADDEVLISPDGVSWTTRRIPSVDSLHHGVASGGQFVFANHDGVVSSPDGFRWNLAVRTSQPLLDVATNGTLYVAVGSTPGALYISADGQTWGRQTTPATVGLASATWMNNQFVAVGENDTLLTSPDGGTWTLRHTGSGLRLNSIAAHGDTVVLGTYGGDILVNKIVQTAAAPEISLAPGAPGSVPQIMMTSATPGAKICYTLDGTPPTSDSLHYSTPFTMPVATTIKARAFKDGMPASAAVEAQFTPGP